jgi:uncharacterized MnhB-related membrane protein
MLTNHSQMAITRYLVAMLMIIINEKVIIYSIRLQMAIDEGSK